MTTASAALVTLVLAVASFTDLRDRVVPNRLTFAAALGGLVIAGLDGPATLATSLFAGLAVSVPLLAIALARPEGMGMGDVKLAGVLGICLAWQALPALLLGCLLAGMTGVLLALGSRRPPSQVALPLAPFMALGTLPVLAWSLQLLQ